MQAAAAGPARAPGLCGTDKLNATSHLTAVDDFGLLKALRIAAAIIERTGDRVLRVTANNDKFVETVERTTCTATDWNEADCLKTGAIAELVQRFLDGHDPNGELDLKQGEGVASQFFRLKLAPLSTKHETQPCLLSVFDRTVEVQAERTLRAEMLRDSLTGLPNRLAFTEAIENAGANVARDLQHAVLVVDMLRFSRINESMGSLAGDELLITFARRLILALRAGDVLARTGGNEFG